MHKALQDLAQNDQASYNQGAQCTSRKVQGFLFHCRFMLLGMCWCTASDWNDFGSLAFRPMAF